MDELRRVTQQYINVDDPIERAARQHRVSQEDDEVMETTAAGIIETARKNLSSEISPPGTKTTVFDRLELPQEASPVPSVFTRLEIQGENGVLPHLPTILEDPHGTEDQLRRQKKKTKRTGSNRNLNGASSRKRNLTQTSPAPQARHGFPYASAILSQPRQRATPRSARRRTRGATSSQRQDANQHDFHIHPPPLP